MYLFEGYTFMILAQSNRCVSMLTAFGCADKNKESDSTARAERPFRRLVEMVKVDTLTQRYPLFCVCGVNPFELCTWHGTMMWQEARESSFEQRKEGRKILSCAVD